MSSTSQITVFVPGESPRTYDLDHFNKPSIRLGRGPFHGDSGAPNDIQIDPSLVFVSRAHCSFCRDADGQWFILDDRSKNGLVFHGEKIAKRALRDGDKIYIIQDEAQRLALVFSQKADRKAEREQPPSADTAKSFPLRQARQCVIGRAADCDIVIDHPAASRRHCIVTQENGQYYVTDNNSVNGVLLNSCQLTRKEQLRPMDRILIADTVLIFSNEHLYIYQLDGGLSVAADHLSRTVGTGKNKKKILNNVTLSIQPNEFVAIIGGSGAGKTTLLNALSGVTGFSTGEVLINGDSIRTGKKGLQSLMGYVPQQDIVYDSLPLERMLLYSARLRMPQDTSEREIEAKIEETLRIVELSEHRKTLISKLSGGQKKRASIAVELLASPRLFFLDEPSSGLDPGTEKHLMQMLKRLSLSGKTVIMVTHTVQNLDLCDRLICMGKGGVLCYSGPPQKAPAFFGKEKYTDIFDDLNERATAVAARFNRVPESSYFDMGRIQLQDMPPKAPKSPRALLREFWVMTVRYVEIMSNSRLRLILLLIMPVILSLLVCVAFQADGNLYNFFMRVFGASMVRANFPFLVATDTMSLMFAFSCAAFWTGIFNSIQEVSKERPIYEREKFSGVSVTPYVFSKFGPLTALCLVQSVIMTVILRIMTNTTATVDGNIDGVTALKYSMPSSGAVFPGSLMGLETFLTVFLCVLSAMCLGLMISTLVSNEMALVLCPICLMPQILFSGVVGTLTGITETLSNFITCRWSCLAFFVSADINRLYKSCYYNMGAWELTTFSDDGGVGLLDAAYETSKEYVFGMNGVSSAWLVLLFMSAVCLAAAVLILRFKRSQTR
ncbi:MAG: ATP-binding cassette domain-containing protein [Clostridia bacterium]|nr:ATP-binding cassette domain-containing protein [Clostridia bacterium]